MRAPSERGFLMHAPRHPQGSVAPRDRNTSGQEAESRSGSPRGREARQEAATGRRHQPQGQPHGHREDGGSAQGHREANWQRRGAAPEWAPEWPFTAGAALVRGQSGRHTDPWAGLRPPGWVPDGCPAPSQHQRRAGHRAPVWQVPEGPRSQADTARPERGRGGVGQSEPRLHEREDGGHVGAGQDPPQTALLTELPRWATSWRGPAGRPGRRRAPPPGSACPCSAAAGGSSAH